MDFFKIFMEFDVLIKEKTVRLLEKKWDQYISYL
jgi:hypothetical protein